MTTQSTNYATEIFYVAEITSFRSGNSAITFEYGYGTVPHGTLAQFSDGPVSANSITYASDVGYRTPASDGDPVVYPPLMTQEFQIDRKIVLPPASAGISAAWGTLSLRNDGNQFSSLVQYNNNDGRNINIYYGTKNYENYLGLLNQRSTAATYFDRNHVMQTANAYTIRTDFSTNTARVLNENAATNLLYPSTDATSGWGLTGTGVVTANATTAPDGTTTAAQFAADSTNGLHGFSITVGTYIPVANTYHTASIFVKANTTSKVELDIRLLGDWANGVVTGVFDLNAMTATCTAGNGTCAISNVGSGWYRISTTGLSSAAPASTFPIWAYLLNSAGSANFVSTGEKAFFWGAQFEQGNAATSYIPTTTAPVVRAADYNVAARNIYIDPHYSALNPIFKGLQSPWQLNELTLDIPLRDASYWLLRPLQQNLYSGSGSYNGTSTLASLPIPMTRGGTSTNPVKNVTPTLIDPPNLIYQYNDAAGTIVALYEGAAITYAFSSDTTNLYVGSTTAGHYRTDNSRGLFQLGSTPTGQITCDVTGKFPVAGTQGNAITIAQYLLSETLAMPSQYINTTNFAAQNALYPYTSGFYYSSNDTPTGIDALNQILFGMGAKLYPARDGTLKVLVLRAPSGNSVATFDTTNTISVSTTPLDAAVDPPTYRVRVGYNHNYTVQTTGIIANATATQRAYVSTTDSLIGATSSAVQTNYKRPNDLPAITGSILSNTAANTIASDLITLWGTRRRTYLVTVPISIGLLRDLGDIVTLTWVMDDLSNGKLGIIVGESFSGVDSTITFTILV